MLERHLGFLDLVEGDIFFSPHGCGKAPYAYHRDYEYSLLLAIEILTKPWLIQFSSVVLFVCLFIHLCLCLFICLLSNMTRERQFKAGSQQLHIIQVPRHFITLIWALLFSNWISPSCSEHRGCQTNISNHEKQSHTKWGYSCEEFSHP